MTTTGKELSDIAIGVLIDGGADQSQDGVCNFVHKFGGDVIACQVPSKSEHPLIKENIHRLITGGIDLAIFLTVAGSQRIAKHAFQVVDRQRVVDSLVDIITLSGNKRVTQFLQELDVYPTISLDNPGSWRDVLTALDRHFHVASEKGKPRLGQGLANLNVAVEETGSILSLLTGLEARGCRVFRLPAFGISVDIGSDLPGSLNSTFERFFESIENDEMEAILISSPDAVIELVRRIKQLRSQKWIDHILDEKLVIAIGDDTLEVLLDLEIVVGVFATHTELNNSPRAVAARIAATIRET